MSLPNQKDIQLPLLKELMNLGGEARSGEVYDKVASHFTSLSADDLKSKRGPGSSRWALWVRWTKQQLVQNGEIVSPHRGLWKLTDKGKKRLSSGV